MRGVLSRTQSRRSSNGASIERERANQVADALRRNYENDNFNNVNGNNGDGITYQGSMDR